MAEKKHCNIWLWKMLKLTQKVYKPMWQWMWLFLFQQLINKYLNHLSMIYDISVYKIYVVNAFFRKQ